MKKGRRMSTGVIAGLVGMAGSLALVAQEPDRAVGGTIWVANRGAHTVRAFDARSRHDGDGGRSAELLSGV